MGELTSKDEFRALQTLAEQLDTCCAHEGVIHVNCVLIVNGVQDCRELTSLLNECFEKNEVDEDPNPLLSAVLSKLAKRVGESAPEYLNEHGDRLDDLRLWTMILKTLCDSCTSHPKMWGQSEMLLNKGRDNMQDVLQKRHKDDPVRKLLLETPELVGFFDAATIEDLYLESVSKTIDCLQSTSDEDDIQKIIDSKPKDFKFPDSVFSKLFQVEKFMLDRGRVDETLQNFYDLMFFAYEHSVDPDKVRQMYSDLDKSVQQMKRKLAALDVYNEFSGKILSGVFERKASQVAYLFHWLKVFDPTTSFVVINARHFEELPNLLPEEQPKATMKHHLQPPKPFVVGTQAREVGLFGREKTESVYQKYSEEREQTWISPLAANNRVRSGMHQTGFGGRSDTTFSPFATNSFGHFGSNRSGDDVPHHSAAPSGRYYIKRDNFSYNRRGGGGRQLSNHVDIEAKNPFAFRNFGSEGLSSNDRAGQNAPQPSSSQIKEE